MSTTPCATCQDTGFVIHDVQGIPRAARCECHRRRANERRLENARIPKRYADCTLESFGPQTALQKKAKRIAEVFLEEYPVESGESGLLFLGRPGVGKTHLAASVLRGLVVEKGVQGLFYDYGDLLRTIQSTWDRDSQMSESSVLDPVKAAEVLLLDDLGATRPSLWVQEVLFHILNTRYNEKRVTILTSNHLDQAPEPSASPGRQRDLMEASLEHQIGSPLRSRLHEMCRTIEIDGKDFREAIKKAENVHGGRDRNEYSTGA